MKNDVRLIIFLSCIVFACSQPGKQREVGKEARIKTDTSYTAAQDLRNAKAEFDIDRFVSMADSLLATVQDQSISLSYSIDTIKKAEVQSPFYALNPSDALVIRYVFDPGAGNRQLRFWFVCANYDDAASASLASATLQKLIGKVNDAYDFSPGLTYTNDYVIRSENKIYWLNTGCSYAFFNHQKLTRLMRRSIPVKTVQDSIHCKCGQPICSLESN